MEVDKAGSYSISREACLKFRKAVAEEFERLLSTGAEGIDRRAPGGRLGVLSSALI